MDQPYRKKLTNLRLHHLTIMDVTLSEKKYMFMNAHEAFQYCKRLINTVRNAHGEISFLWHNNSVEKNVNSYHRTLYKDVLKYLQKEL